MMKSLDQQNVVVIGGSSGIGRATAAAALERGASVTVAARGTERLETLKQEFPAITTEVLQGTDEAAVQAFFDQQDVVDHVYVSVGTGSQVHALGAGLETMMPMVDDRIKAAILAAKYAAPKIRKGGSVTFTSGISAHKTIPGEGIGGMSCSAVETLARSLAVEMKPIRFNAIVPGATDTPFLNGILGDHAGAVREFFRENVPAGRFADPEEIAHAVMFLMENRFVTGTALVVSGGHHLI